jgi:CRP-like cAMP-binding protein
MELAKTLANNFMFRGLPQSFVNTLAASADVRQYHGGETLVRQFDKGQDLYVILEGQAVTRNFQGDIVARFGPGSVVGEMALVDGAPRSANVITAGPAKVAVVSAECIEGLVELDAAFGNTLYHNIAKVLCRRLRSMNENTVTPPLASVR